MKNLDSILLIIALLLIALPLYLYINRFSEFGLSYDSTDFGVFGDYVGGVIGTIVAIYGAVFIYKTYRQQENLSTIQQFENNFFQLLNQQRDIIKTLNGKIGKRSYSGYGFIKAIHEELKVPMDDPEIMTLSGNNLRYKINDFYTDLFNEHTSQLGHYLRHLYHILKYIDISYIEEKKKKEYADILQAQMTTDELYLLALNGVSEFGWKKAKPLIDKYSLLENLAIEKDDTISYVIENFYPMTVVKHGTPKKENIIFVGGVHGVGKTYFVENLPEDIKRKIKTLSCSEIMGWNKKSKDVIDTNENQRRLIFNLRDEIEEDKKYFLVGHFCLVNKHKRIERIPLDTFRAINPKSLILINDSSDEIVKRLEKRGDVDNWNKNFIDKLIEEENLYANKISKELGIPLICYKSTDIDYTIVKDDLNDFFD